MNNYSIESCFHKSRTSPKVAIALLLPAFITFGCGGMSNNPRNPYGDGPAAVSLSTTGEFVVPGDLSSAGSYVILAKTGVTNVTGSAIVGNIGVSPSAATYITGFALTADASNEFSTSASVTGNIYSATYAVPTPSNLTSAIGNMETAYTDAAGRSPADRNELATGNLGGLTLAPGLYKWTTHLIIPTDFTISGSATDVWIFQTSGNITMSAAKSVILSGGAQAKNIFWQVAGEVTIGTTSHFEGIILSKTAITLQTNASMNGRAFGQSLVALDNNAIIQP